MKTVRLLSLLILSVVLLNACQKENPLVPEPGIESMKGYELYSWEKDGAWYFSILIGTNREKKIDEIQSPDADGCVDAEVWEEEVEPVISFQ